MKVQQTVSLHEKALTRIASGEVMPIKKRKNRMGPKNSRVKVRKRHEEVDATLAAYVRSNEIDWRRVEVVDRKTIIVHNNPASQVLHGAY